jgi:hypothetical protein
MLWGGGGGSQHGNQVGYYSLVEKSIRQGAAMIPSTEKSVPVVHLDP